MPDRIREGAFTGAHKKWEFEVRHRSRPPTSGGRPGSMGRAHSASFPSRTPNLLDGAHFPSTDPDHLPTSRGGLCRDLASFQVARGVDGGVDMHVRHRGVATATIHGSSPVHRLPGFFCASTTGEGARRFETLHLHRRLLPNSPTRSSIIPAGSGNS